MGVITAEWWHNFDAEMSLLGCMLETHKIASIDTEFPRLIRSTPRKADAFARYEDVKSNVARSILIQVGVTWVTFHGLYDLAHLVPLFTGRPLPESLFDFVVLVERWFGRVFDIKSMAGPYRHMLGNPEYLGLEKLATMVGVNRVGRAHQAGSDSLVTAQVFSRFITIFCNLEKPTPVESVFQLEGFLFGVSIRVVCPSNRYHDHHVNNNLSTLVSNMSHLIIK
ncbi:hypothetical protein Cgig2_014507 [Carnegiea gigantea]|uniref:poly(A)-specific ribonuclease n=1 Tax=Carnegiea gigantea TaxID=171969 RepID=A0A9Q1JXZ0_9CARY|nr:hypothetical protein Cgig2_014507 [Carnegiea gigantea]